jgi:hypothetical protein
MTMISVRYHFLPHPVINNLKQTNANSLTWIVSAILSATLFKEIAV